MQPLPAEVLALARELGAAVIEVPDTAHAITDLAREWRGHLKGRVIGVTGSAGKTTTKNLVRDVLAAAHTVVATEGNQNNELGVPKTLLVRGSGDGGRGGGDGHARRGPDSAAVLVHAPRLGRGHQRG